MRVTTHNTAETIELGKRFVRGLRGGEVVLLIGDLGAGKTTFVKGVAKALGVKRTVTSPTFVLMKVYEVKSQKSKVKSPSNPCSPALSPAPPRCAVKNLVHIDTYRGLSIADLENVGALEYFGRNDTICFVEWGEGLEDYLRARKIRTTVVKIKNIDSETREIII
ncbi:tRNA (adenosine(37)-N6)-threonylcarbamoyltransferase complex ATPase subunit type 1 TsaE [Candidatus Falkowbacteria bacterium RIFOXYC2_FULL_48_21]|uniref:tRNA threonylcarbamoyladenosine biosynthesis protein TsaE n=1 Tax=Candidatus Falkowbacteria bacterium RIFOXYC2_FULL_48_21 TaxID=1798005 RepID=A0A1F5TCD4_9BACT|nr:MAG: tRNA (adenosine(37)-N6)-threonylcarbamoyltransferase complex ATPase subunit type 1 TsaE [Candidatus Falkowbacteria bacterium RIFOXYC2_FULL_48_21]